MKEAKYPEKQKRQDEKKTSVAKTTRRDACATKNERKGTKPKSNAQFIRKVGRDE